jgi:hypothetical protein
MSKGNGYLQHRRGIWEHVKDGRMSLADVAVHLYIAEQADTRTGVWNGSAGALAGELCISDRMARRFLERLTRRDYIRRFPVPGKHVCYPILVHKFHVTNGEHKGEQLDAISSLSPMDLRYQPIENGELEGEQKGEHVSSQKILETREVRKTHTPSVSELPTAEGFEQFHAAYPRHVAKADAEKAWRQVVKPEEVPAILARIEINKLGEWKGMEKRFIPHPASWLRGRRWNDEIEKGAVNGNHNAAAICPPAGKYENVRTIRATA